MPDKNILKGKGYRYMEKIILAKYGEIILKGLNRPIFEDKLIGNIRKACSKYKLKITKAQATIYITPKEENVDLEEVAELVSNVFGVVSVCIAYIAEKDLESICDLAKKLTCDKVGTFKVESKRSDKKFPHKSPVISREVGGAILQGNSNLTVDVKNPDFLVKVEVRDFGAYIYTDKIIGVGGMPIGTNGKATLMLSGGIDSPVAGYMIAKRGVELTAVHFYSYPYTSERAKEKVLELTKILARYCGKINIHIVPFTDIQLAINEFCPEEQLTIIMRRIMMYITNIVTESVGAKAIVTGESVGQVASQTTDALMVTDNAAKFPVFRPLIGMDKDEIVAIARKIGTFETSILPYEDCCTVFTPKHPNTKPVLEKILKSEAKLDLDRLIDEAVKGIEVIKVTPDMDLF